MEHVQGLSPVWTILHQVYYYTSLLDRAIKQLCNVSIIQESDTTRFHSFCTTTVLTSNHKDAFLNPTEKIFSSVKQEKLLRTMFSSIDKHGWARGAVQADELILLHKRLGDDVMTFLLTKCSLFVQIGKNYVQIAGIPIYNVLALNYTPLLKKHTPVKRKARTKRLEQRKSIKATANAVAHDETSEPLAKKPRTSGLQQELQVYPGESNALTAISQQPISTGKENTHTSDEHVTVSAAASETRKKSKRRKPRVNSRSVFGKYSAQMRQSRKRKRLVTRLRKQLTGRAKTSPAEKSLQRSIRSVWQIYFRKIDTMYSSASKEALERSHFLNVCNSSRRAAIKLVSNMFMSKPQPRTNYKKPANKKIHRLPKRLLPVVPLFQSLLSNYKKISKKLVHIINSVCAIPTTETELNEGGEREKMLLATHCSQAKVLRFIECVLNSLIPMVLWGSPANKAQFFSHILTNLQKFVCLRRWERVSVRQLMQGVKTTHCAWLQVHSGQHSCRSESLKQTEMLGRFLTWLMKLVADLIKGFFYATEHSDYHNRVLYYRKPVWNKLCKMALDERDGVMLSQLNQEEVDFVLSRGKSLGVSNLRFIPKTSSLRPITNLGSAARLNPTHFVLSGVGQRETKPVNTQLLNLFNILKFEKSLRLCSSCLGFGDIHNKLNSFSKTLREAALPGTTNRRSLFFVHMDITNCFDSIDPRVLYSIIKNRVLTQQSYLLRRYTTVMISNRAIRRSFLKAGTTRELCEPFMKFAGNLSSLRNAILTDMVAYPLIDRLQLLSQLKSHLFSNIVKFRNQFFRQTKGIPQGSCISSLLCSFYYDEMVKEHLPKVNPETGLLMHYVDDFLLLTRDPNTAKTFLETMTKGIPEYNCLVNPNKTATNFTVGDEGTLHLDEEKVWMPWCGLLINTRNLEVRSDYSRYTGKKIRDHLTVVTHSRPFHNLHRLVKRAVRLKCQPIFLDCELLSEKTVLSNIYQLFLMVAVKTHTAVRALQLRGKRGRRYTRFLISVIRQSTRFFYNTARAKCKKREGGPTTFTLPLQLCTWLGCHAYQRVMQLKDPHGHTYGLLVKVLSSLTSTVADAMGLDQVKRCLRATSLTDCQTIIRLKC